MSAIVTASEGFQLLATPDPNERALRVSVRCRNLLNSALPTEGEAFSALTLVPLGDLVKNEFGTYVFMDCVDVADGWLGLSYGKAKTEAQKKTPFKTTTSFDLDEWDTVLFGLGMIPDRNFLRSTIAAVNGQKTLISGPSYRVRPLFVQGGAYGTKFVVKEYLAPTPFKIPRHRTPVGTSVSYDTGDRQGTFERCLHDTISIGRQLSVSATVAGDSGGASAGVIAGTEFPATDMQTWERHVAFDKQQKHSSGLQYRTKIVKIPPPIPELISS